MLESMRIKQIDRPKVDPFSIREAEALIFGIHVEWGEAIGNFDEFRFFTGLRHSEEMALRVRHCDLEKGTIHIKDVIVLGRDKDRPCNRTQAASL
jgi:integrase